MIITKRRRHCAWGKHLKRHHRRPLSLLLQLYVILGDAPQIIHLKDQEAFTGAVGSELAVVGGAASVSCGRRRFLSPQPHPSPPQKETAAGAKEHAQAFEGLLGAQR